MLYDDGRELGVIGYRMDWVFWNGVAFFLLKDTLFLGTDYCNPVRNVPFLFLDYLVHFDSYNLVFTIMWTFWMTLQNNLVGDNTLLLHINDIGYIF